MIRKDKNCMICNSKNIINVFELKTTPPADMFLPKDKLKLSAKKYPLILALCKNDFLTFPFVHDGPAHGPKKKEPVV